VNPGLGAAVDHLVRQPHLVIGGRVERVRVLRVHHQIDNADLFVDVEDLLPGGAAIGRLEDAPLLIGRVEVPHRCDVDGVGAGGMNDDAGDVMRVFQPHLLPRLACIGRLVDAVAGV
jgi:hypothetical protein